MPVTPGPSPEYGIDSLMPIYPNTRFAKGQSGYITPETPFPFDTCFFQRNGDIPLRLRPNGVGFNAAYGFKIDIKEHLKIHTCWDSDLELLVQPDNVTEQTQPAPSAGTPQNASDSDQGLCAALDGSNSDLHPNTFLLSNPFGWDHDPCNERLPLVDGWIELEEHFSSDSIPDPRGLYEECDEIQS